MKRVLMSLGVVLAALFIVAMGCSKDQDVDTVVTPQLAKTAGNAGHIQSAISIPAHLRTETTAEGCTNNPGPFITLTGELTLSGVNGRLVFRNNERGTHERTEDVVVDVSIIPAGETIRFAKQPPQGGVGGNPHIWIQFVDGNGDAISGITYLGRCVQGLSTNELDFGFLGHAAADIATGDCSNSPGPYITVSGELSLGGLGAKLYFTNNRKWTHSREERTEVSIVILPAGESITFAKQPPLGGVGGNPRIYFQFIDGYGDALSKLFYLGRCVQLGK